MCLFVLLLSLIPAARAATADIPPPAGLTEGLFGSHEFKSTKMAAFTKWTGMLERFRADEASTGSECLPTRFARCHYKAWVAFIADLKDRDSRSQIEAVHRYMNLSPYVTDPRNWGKRDYWETPGEFFRKDGDCEDYAIAKYLTLRALGLDVSRMRVVVVQDLNLKVPHAVLVVYEGDRALILDNQIPQVVDATSVYHYRPIYSINENAWWLHRR